MHEDNKGYIMFFSRYAGCLFFFGIITIVCSSIPFSCNNTDPIGINVSSYLLGVSISQIVSSVVICTFGLYLTSPHNLKNLSVMLSLLLVFDIIWAIIGGIVIFRSNLGCLNIHDYDTVMVKYAIVVWTLSLLGSISVITVIYNLYTSVTPKRYIPIQR
jgi:hypothetical protein